MDRDREEPRTLSFEEMEATRGGVEANIQWPPSDGWSQSFDNLRFQADVISLFGQTSNLMTIHADDTKVGFEVVSTPAPGFTGELHTRTNWPFPGFRDMSIRFLLGNQLFPATGNSSLADQRLHPDVKVHTIKFWNITDPSGSTSVPLSLSRQVVDLLTPPIPDVSSDTIDGIYAQCPVLTKTQWRVAGSGTLNLTNTCSDLAGFMGGGSCTPQTCIDEIWNTTQNDPNNVHVVYVDTLGCGWAGAHWTFGGSDKYLIVLTDDSTTTPAFFTRLLAHELGHAYVGGHVNGTPLDNCTNTAPQRNLMCSNVGRLMVSSQCTAAQNDNEYVDRN